jgi:thioredoxin
MKNPMLYAFLMILSTACTDNNNQQRDKQPEYKTIAPAAANTDNAVNDTVSLVDNTENTPEEITNQVIKEPVTDIAPDNKTEQPALISKPVQLTKAGFLEKVWDYEKHPQQWIYKGDLPCIIDFYADWCAPCRKAAPILEELAKEYAGKLIIYKVNTQTEREMSAAFGIRSIPAFLYCTDNKNPEWRNGIGRTDDQTKQLFEQNINSLLL